MSTRFTKIRRLAYGALALATVSALSLPALLGHTSAAGQVTSRSIKLTTSAPSATGVTYTVTFSPATGAQTIGGIVVDFCGDSPIIGNTTCTLPTAFTLGSSVTLANPTNMGAGWVATNSLQGGAAGGQKQVAVLTNSTPQTLTAPVSFDLTGVTNPSSTGTFYARIYTFDTSSNTTTNYTASGTTRAANPTGKIDYGGIALSTATSVNISATVQEQLTFCVSAAAPGTGCSGTTAPNVTLGTGTPVILTTGAAQTGTAYFQVTTNAVNNVNVNLKVTSSTTCAGLSRDGGATCPIAAHTGFTAISASAGEFGLNVSNGSGGTGTETANANYGTTAGSYGMRTQTYGTYGDTVSTTTGATSDVNTTLTYAANAAPTTPAGVYTATHSYIATGSY